MAADTSDVLCSAWADLDDIPEDIRDGFPDTITDDMITAELMRASEILWALSGRVWLGGGCTETALVKSQPPTAGAGQWPYSTSWGHCGCWAPARTAPYSPGLFFRNAHVAAPTAIRLPRSPVTEVTEVLIGGEVFEAWELRPSGWLERTDGQAWNVCGGDTEITYTFGYPPPAGGRDAAIELAIEFVRYRYALDGCRLPRRATQITRQGVSVTLDPTSFLSKGGTGLLGVDLWLRAVNPDARPQGSMVWSPDLPSTMRI